MEQFTSVPLSLCLKHYGIIKVHFQQTLIAENNETIRLFDDKCYAFTFLF